MAAVHERRHTWLTGQPAQADSTSGAALRAERACGGSTRGGGAGVRVAPAAPIGGGAGGASSAAANGPQAAAVWAQRHKGSLWAPADADEPAWDRRSSSGARVAGFGELGVQRGEHEARARDQFGAATRPTWSKGVVLTKAAAERVGAQTQQSAAAAVEAMRIKRQAANKNILGGLSTEPPKGYPSEARAVENRHRYAFATALSRILSLGDAALAIHLRCLLQAMQLDAQVRSRWCW